MFALCDDVRLVAAGRLWYPGCNLASKLLLDKGKVNDLACLPSHEHCGIEEKQMGLSVRSLPFLLLSMFPFTLGPKCLLVWAPLLLMLSTLHLHQPNSLSFTFTLHIVLHPSVSVPTDTSSPSLQCVLLDSGPLCTVQSSVYESPTTAQIYSTHCLGVFSLYLGSGANRR